MKATPTESTSIRLRLSPEQATRLATVQRFLGLPSLSQTAARLALWNADMISAALGDEAARHDAADASALVARSLTLSAIDSLK